MSLFAGYHFLGEDNERASLQPGEGADALPDDRAGAPLAQRSTGLEMCGVAGDDHARVAEQQFQVMVETAEAQLTAERARISRLAEQVRSLARELCPQALDDARRKIGDVKIAAWTPERWLAFIREQVKAALHSPAASVEAGFGQSYTLLLQDLAGLRAENARLKELAAAGEREPTGLRPEAEVLRQKPAPAPAAPAAAMPSALSPVGSSVAANGPDSSAIEAHARGEALPFGENRIQTAESQTPAAQPDQRPAPKVDPARVDELVRLIAATGLARLAKIRERLAAMWGVEARSGSIQNAVNAAITLGAIRVYEARQSDWQGAKPKFIELTPAGAARAREMGISPVVSEITGGLQRGLAIEMVNLILRASDLLREAGNQRIMVLPEPVALADSLMYQPTISAVAPDGAWLFVECERETSSTDRSERWRLAAQANNGQVWLMTTNAQMQAALLSEINLVRVDHPFRLAACNVADYGNGKRGRDGDIWLYRSS